jgi:hypothetical protein
LTLDPYIATPIALPGIGHQAPGIRMQKNIPAPAQIADP